MRKRGVTVVYFLYPTGFRQKSVILTGHVGNNLTLINAAPLSGGFTENAGPENEGPQKQDRKMEDTYNYWANYHNGEVFYLSTVTEVT